MTKKKTKATATAEDQEPEGDTSGDTSREAEFDALTRKTDEKLERVGEATAEMADSLVRYMAMPPLEGSMGISFETGRIDRVFSGGQLVDSREVETVTGVLDPLEVEAWMRLPASVTLPGPSPDELALEGARDAAVDVADRATKAREDLAREGEELQAELDRVAEAGDTAAVESLSATLVAHQARVAAAKKAHAALVRVAIGTLRQAQARAVKACNDRRASESDRIDAAHAEGAARIKPAIAAALLRYRFLLHRVPLIQIERAESGSKSERDQRDKALAEVANAFELEVARPELAACGEPTPTRTAAKALPFPSGLREDCYPGHRG